ncbi:MAG: hypothetical protein HOG49_36575 [Candidatus Scalindua sp.]|jgi:hypothetical protein|nr:hypothetical protein [Candidatus Scalindua sp.]
MGYKKNDRVLVHFTHDEERYIGPATIIDMEVKDNQHGCYYVKLSIMFQDDIMWALSRAAIKCRL